MPNWCLTEYTFHGNESDINAFHALVKKNTSKRTDDYLADIVLSNICDAIGLEQYCKDNWEICRGQLVGQSDITKTDNDYKFVCYAETAWVAMPQFWNKIIETCGYSSVKYSYFAQETGNGYYEIYDPHHFEDYTDEWVIDCDVRTDEDDEYSENTSGDEETIKTCLQKALLTDENDFEKLLEMAKAVNADDSDDYIYVDKIKYVYEQE